MIKKLLFISLLFILISSYKVYGQSKRYVYIEDNSALFHSYACKELTKTPHKVELDVAIDKGYYACIYCLFILR